MQNWSQNIHLSELTSIKLGGDARYFYECKSRAELPELIESARTQNIPVFILGGGSNTLFADEGFGGLVIKIGFSSLKELPEKGTKKIAVEAGYEWDKLVEWAVKHSIVGIEAMSGIPGSIGGTPIQNVGAYGQEVSEVIDKVEVFDTKNMKFLFFGNEECEFSYRMSRFKGRDAGRYVITTVFFNFTQSAVQLAYPELERKLLLQQPEFAQLPLQTQLKCVRETVIELRKGKSMVLDPADLNSRSLGSFFTNPVLLKKEYQLFEERLAEIKTSSPCPHYAAPGGTKLSAAWLVENSGFAKGYRYKGVGVSQNHSLALVNYQGTTADLLHLADQIKKTVFEKFGVAIHREPVLVGGTDT